LTELAWSKITGAPSFITGNQTITLSGDVTGSGATSISTTLATVNSNVGSFGNSTTVPTFTVNAKGLITAASSTSIPTAATASTGLLTATDWNIFNGKQAALSGTGFVKISGTTISYDNSTYALASALSGYLPLSGGTLTGALVGTTSAFNSSTLGSASNATTLLTMSVAYSASNTQRGAIVWNDGSGVTGKIHSSYNGSNSTKLHFGGLYNGSYNQGDLMVLDGITNSVTLSGALSGTSAAFSGAGSFLGTFGVGTASPSSVFQVTAAAGTAHARWTESSTTVGFVGGAQGLVSGYNGYLMMRGENGLVLSGQGNAANVVIYPSTGNTVIKGTADNGTDALQVAGSVSATKLALAGSTGETFTSQGVAGEWSGRYVANSSTNNSYGLIVNGGTSLSDIALKVTSQSGGTDYLVTRGDGQTTIRKAVVSGGSGEVMTVTGTVGEWAQRITSPNSTNNSFGLTISAGTSSSDFALNIANAASTVSLFNIKGDGAATFSSSVTATSGVFSSVVNVNGASTVEALNVNGNIHLQGTANRYIRIQSATNYHYNLQSVGDDFQILEAGTIPRLTIRYPNGNVGIGNLASNAKLEVTATTGEVFRADAASGAFRIIANQTGVLMNGGGATTSTLELGSGDNAAVSSPYSMVFQTNNTGAISGRDFVFKNGGKGYSDGTTLFTISSTGAVTATSSITANATSTFSNASNISAIFSNGGAVSNFNSIELRGGTGGTAVNWQISKDNFAANAFEITPSTTNGGTTYATYAMRLTSTGAATFSSSVTATSFFESSDSRLKTLISDNYNVSGIDMITPKLYQKNGKTELGYYAQDLVGVLDSAVTEGQDGMLSLSYREVLVAKIYALEQEVKMLKSKYGV
jgi:hypothetical protein